MASSEMTSMNASHKTAPETGYQVSALAVTIFYGLISIFASASVISNPSPSPGLLFLLIIFDTLMAGIVAASTGAAGGVAYIGLKGNDHVNWMKICDKFGKYCRHVGSSIGLSLVASVVLVLLVILSSYSLYRRIR
ncbi:CASP-like protein 1D1 [Asparagus officinalis]|uniref:CASP-like protein 1D1 n=1 Tax=Asparagus officinalis TaxID=4686 RepID=UPI00098E276B|nr:CASP-like protein 1D1 [Asparagus officinalis]